MPPRLPARLVRQPPTCSAEVIGPSWRGRCLGTALLETLIDRATQRRHRALGLSVEHDNPAARLYARLGFIVADSAETALTVIRHLPDMEIRDENMGTHPGLRPCVLKPAIPGLSLDLSVAPFV